MKMKTFIVLLLLQVLMISAQQVKLAYHTIKVPGGSDWAKCADSPAFASYAIKLAGPNAVLDPTNYDGATVVTPNYKATVQGNGFKAIVADTKKNYIPGSFCGKVGPANEAIPVGTCMLQGPIPSAGTWCLLIENPFLNEQWFDVVLSFTQSVFVDGSYRKNSSQTVLPPSTKNNYLMNLSVNGNNNKRNLRRSYPLRLDRSL